MSDKTGLTDALADCLDALQRNDLSLQECLDRYPQHKEELFALLQKFEAIQSLPIKTIRSEFRKKSHQALLNTIKTCQPELPSDRLRRPAARKQRRFSPVQVIAAAALAFVSVTGGVAYASDGAAPGDALYGLDRAIERIRLRMTADVDDAIALHLKFAEERLREVEDRLTANNMEDTQAALEYYDGEIEALAKLIQSPDGFDELGNTELIDAALNKHSDVLLRVLEKVPQQAQEAIQKAIDAQEKVRGYLKNTGKPDKPDKPGKPDKTGRPEETEQLENLGSQEPEEIP